MSEVINLIRIDARLTVRPEERERIRSYYGDVLGCSLATTSAAADVFRLGRHFHLGVVYDDAAPSMGERRKLGLARASLR